MMADAQAQTAPGAHGAWQGKYPILVTAHRGFSGAAPENTLAAFQAAIAAGADMIEMDVHLSTDGKLVVIHDDTLNRTTNGKGNVADKTLAELQRLDAGAWFDPRFAGEKIPTLAEVLVLTRGRIALNIELKKGKDFPYTMEELADRTLDEVERAGMLDQVLFSSFDPVAIERIQARNTHLPIGLITEKPWATPEEAGGGKLSPTLNSLYKNLNAENVRLAHARGVRIHAWTVNTPEEMEQMITLGVDGIITNHPARLIDLLRRPVGR
jgi:glycerophosphoryl diester phosphodiesterase